MKKPTKGRQVLFEDTGVDSMPHAAAALTTATACSCSSVCVLDVAVYEERDGRKKGRGFRNTSREVAIAPQRIPRRLLGGNKREGRSPGRCF